MAAKKRSGKRIALWVVGILILIFALMQAVPYGRSHSNPPVTDPFAWIDPQAEAIARVSCYDCHSNETDWWWATNIAPFSWLVQADVNGGRDHLNFSDYQGRPDAAGFQRAIEEGMPPFQYTIIHWGARLTDAEKQTLIHGYADSIAAGAASSNDGSQGSTDTTVSGDAAAVATINEACLSCHSAQPALNFRASSSAEAQAMIDDMARRGAKLTADQTQQLIAYFTR